MYCDTLCTLLIILFSVPLIVGFEKKVYEVVESDGSVEVCVILTQPDHNILNNSVNVEVFVNDDSVYIPSNVNIASKLKNELVSIKLYRLCSL